MKPKQFILFSSAAAALTAAILAYRRDRKEIICRSIYHRGKEDCIKEQNFKTKSYPPSPKVIAATLDKFGKFCDDTLQWLEHMLLYNEIELQSIPRSIRASSRSVYIMAFRISSRKPTPCERFIKDMNTLCEDICSLDSDDTDKDDLVKTFSTYLNMNEHKEDEIFVNFEKNLCEEILWEMRKHDKALRKSLEEQLKNRGLK